MNINMETIEQTGVTDEILTSLIMKESMSHKLNRILFQQEFKNSHENQFNELTKRELEITTLIAIGLTNPEIAEKLFISRHTVEQHRKNINRKLTIKSFSDIYQYALAFDLV